MAVTGFVDPVFYAGGRLSADGSPGLARVFSRPGGRMYYKTSTKCATADAAYTLTARCFDPSGDEVKPDSWGPQSLTSSQEAEQYSGYQVGGGPSMLMSRITLEWGAGFVERPPQRLLPRLHLSINVLRCSGGHTLREGPADRQRHRPRRYRRGSAVCLSGT
ncbi:hypothetical protein HZZ00_19210 [Streptomyces sp. NEAU-sy36]|uniref:hypothetical protein n=1 Tax=unclassified Streptomyces TaxID=2593676 RepID=UPI0015D65CF2|nr:MULTISPECIES: hypothetical protein [unclassified Streptomyces]QLJ02920.1 hypothetical protein HZZ00_19210 [Streptomyces sp. NEAU-sy36]